MELAAAWSSRKCGKGRNETSESQPKPSHDSSASHKAQGSTHTSSSPVTPPQPRTSMPQASFSPAAHPSPLSSPDPCWEGVLAHLGVSLLLPHEAVGGQAQLGHARVPRVLHQRPDLVRPGDVVRGTGAGKGKAGSGQALRAVWLCH